MNSESRAVRHSGVLAEEDELVDLLAGHLSPPQVQVVLLHYALVVLEQPNMLIREAPDSLQATIITAL